MKTPTLFGNQPLVMHLLRGAIGMAALGYALLGHESSALIWSAAMLTSILAFRGCPTCWTMGLIQAIQARIQGKPATGCLDGSCAVENESAEGQAGSP